MKDEVILTQRQLNELQGDMAACVTKLMFVEHFLDALGLRIETHDSECGSICRIEGCGSLQWFFEPELGVLTLLDYRRDMQKMKVHYQPDDSAVWLALEFSEVDGWTSDLERSNNEGRVDPLILELADRFKIPGLDAQLHTAADYVREVISDMMQAKRLGLPEKPKHVQLSEEDALMILRAIASPFMTTEVK